MSQFFNLSKNVKIEIKKEANYIKGFIISQKEIIGRISIEKKLYGKFQGFCQINLIYINEEYRNQRIASLLYDNILQETFFETKGIISFKDSQYNKIEIPAIYRNRNAYLIDSYYVIEN